MLDRLLRGPAWVAFVGVLLAGIVFFNVSLLQVGGDITHASQRASALKRENAELRLRVAKLGSTDRIQREAAAQGFSLPRADEVTYLESNLDADARAAARALDERADSSALATTPAGETAETPTATGPAEAGAPSAPSEPAAGARTAAPPPTDPAG